MNKKYNYEIAKRALENLNVLLRYNLENIDEYVKKLEIKESVQISFGANCKVMYNTSKMWLCPKCESSLLGMVTKDDAYDKYNYCPHCGVALEWVD